MSIVSETTRLSYAGNGATTSFPVTFDFEDGVDLVVMEINDSTKVETVKTITTHYTVSGGSGTTGTVVMLAAPASGVTLLIYHDPEVTQESEFEQNGPLPVSEIERALDKLTSISQRLSSQVDRCLKLSEGFTGSFDSKLPGVLTGTVLIGLNSTGDGLQLYSTSSGGGGSGLGDVVGPVVATDNAIARFDSTTGKLIQNSGVTVDDSAKLTAADINVTSLTASRAVVTDASKNLATIATTSTELGYVAGVTSAIQAQIDAAAKTSGLNLIGLNTSWVPTTPDDRNFETSVGNWVSYADAASTDPVDMTGGSPNITFARTTTAGEVIGVGGAGSGKITKTAANRQGEGISCLLNIPIGYQGIQCKFSLAWKKVSGTLVDGDLKLVAYDVTNSALIQLVNTSIIGENGRAEAGFLMPKNSSVGNLQIRIGLHFASSNATAVTLVFDDLIVEPMVFGSGAVVTPLVPETGLTFSAGFGTTTALSASSFIHGQMYTCFGQVTTGTVAASPFYITLPAGKRLDTTFIGAKGKLPGGMGNLMGTSVFVSSNGHVVYPFYDGTNADRIYFAYQTSGGDYVQVNGDGISFSSSPWCFHFTVPLANLVGSTSVTTGSTFYISSLIAGGTRVTATPAKLGEYRTYTKTGSSFACTDNAPTNGPSVTNGMEIYGVNYATAGTNGQPNRWEIYVGKNKHIQVDGYSAAAKTGRLDMTFYNEGTLSKGGLVAYDQSTGVMSIDFCAMTTATVTKYVGWTIPAAGSAYVQSTSGYFDVLVSDNPLVNLSPSAIYPAPTPTITGLGTVTNAAFFYYESDNGLILNYYGTGTAGTVAASVASITLPSGYTVRTGVAPINNTSGNPGGHIGTWYENAAANSSGAMVTATATSTSLVYFGGATTGATMLTPSNGSAIMGSNQVFSVNMRIPVTKS